MSLLSRNTGGRRASAKMAAVFAGTLLMYLVVTALPASAASSCVVNGTNAFQLDVTVGTDDSFTLGLNGGAADQFTATTDRYVFSLNGGAFVDCGAGATGTLITFVAVTGSNAGNETFALIHPDGSGIGEDMTVDNIVVSLGNGNDSIAWLYGGLGAVPDPGSNDCLTMGQAVGGLVVDADCGGAADEFVRGDVEGYAFSGGDGDDTLDAGNFTGPISADTGNGTTTADDLPASSVPANVNTTLNGGNGDDTLYSGNGNDNFVGGPGADLVSYEASGAGVKVSLTLEQGTGMGNDTLSDVQDVTGSPFADQIQGNSLDNVLLGGAGDDQLAGSTGNDTVSGEAGDDTIIENGPGANGADSLSGGASTVVGDTLDYSVARNTDTIVKPGAGAVSGEDANSDGTAEEGDSVTDDFETIMTGGGNDTIVAAGGSINYFTAGGNDKITGSGTSEYFDPGTGINQVDGAGGFDELDMSGQTGPSTIDPAPAAAGLEAGTFIAKATTAVNAYIRIEKLDGTAQNDVLTLDGSQALASFVAGDGDDSIIWNGLGPLPNFSGGAGHDVVDASSATTAVAINLSAFIPGNDVEDAIGGSGSDTLTGNTLDNVLTGNDGADAIFAGLGNDTVEGGLGNDALTDGGGADTLVYRNAPSGETIDTANGFASGGDGEDSLSGNWETVLGSDFNDVITAGQTAFDLPNRLQGFKGNDTITGSNSTDLIKGGAGKDDLRGGGGDDTIRGSGGSDTLIGSNGDDILKGGNGDDSLVGGKGYDIGNGGRGNDSCRQVEQRHSC